MLLFFNYPYLFIGHFKVFVLCKALIRIKVFQVNSQRVIAWKRQIMHYFKKTNTTSAVMPKYFIFVDCLEFLAFLAFFFGGFLLVWEKKLCFTMFSDSLIACVVFQVFSRLKDYSILFSVLKICKKYSTKIPQIQIRGLLF